MGQPLTQSYVCGVSDKPLIYKTIGQLFDETCSRFPEREALVVCHQNIRWTYAELKNRVDAFAATLLKLGLEPGDRIGIWAPNVAEWAVTQIATAKAGLILVNINPAYRSDELAYALNKVGCKALVTADVFKTTHYIEILQDLAPELHQCAPGELSATKLPSLKTVIRLGVEKTPGMFNFDDILFSGRPEDEEKLEALAADLTPDDPINIQFTSGTTGFPKGATLTHFNILNNGYFVTDLMHFSERDRLCITVPLYHCFGMVMGNLGSIAHGATMVYPAPVFNARDTLNAIHTEKCTALYGVPTMFVAQLNHPDYPQFDLSSLRTGLMSGAPCPMELIKQVVDIMHLKDILICYGMTETSPVSFQCHTDDSLDIRVSRIGQVHPHVEAKVVDEQGQTLPPNTTGELLIRGYSVMRGYWDDEALTRQAVDEAGWMHTGDLAIIDEHGYADIVGRLKDMVIRGGENIYPREIEEFLYKHPQIEEVQCVGVPDAKYGEELCVWVKPKEGAPLTETMIRAFCQENIAHYKVPRYIKLVDTFPMTVTGKIRKVAIRDAMIEELALDHHATKEPSTL